MSWGQSRLATRLRNSRHLPATSDHAMSTPVIETEKTNLHLTTGKTQLHILKDVSFSLNAGEVAAVVGPSGSGKTSLLMVLGGLEKATSGRVAVGGRDITNLNEDQLAIFRRQTLSIVFQSFHLIPSMTALEDVSLAGDAPPRDDRPGWRLVM